MISYEVVVTALGPATVLEITDLINFPSLYNTNIYVANTGASSSFH